MQKLYADGQGPCYTYTDDGNLATRTWARGVTTSYTYDAWGSLTSTTYSDGTPSVTFVYDALGRRTAIGRSGTMMSESRSDAYGYNDRSELVSAAKNGVTEYAYQYDDIGNRESSVEPDNSFSYSANELNQYTSILQLQLPTPADFTPQHDEDGNQMLVKTKTGIWQVAYNGENRPVSWTCGTKEQWK